jgi:regulator of protease activity HflC (stomatin/prohibitin superfamily)
MEASVAVAEARATSSAYQQFAARAQRGLLAAALALAVFAVGAGLIAAGSAAHTPALNIVGIVVLVVAGLSVPGFVVVQPNESRVLILFGRYIGTVTEAGLWWVNPLTVVWRETISLRVRNFQGARIKVNDASGNPIEIAAVVVWRVTDTAKAVFDVEDFEQFVVVQSETAVRHLASQFPYDDYNEGAVSLRRNTDDVLAALHGELQQRLAPAGIAVLETRLTHLAYASEIAEVMLRRQQAEAIVAARGTMVRGAVGLVELALNRLTEDGVVELDAERKAAMVSNLMVVLSGDHSATPVINAGSLYT